MLVENFNTSAIYIQVGASFDNDWGRSFIYIRKRGSPRMEPCDTPYLNVPVSEKTSRQTKSFPFRV